MAKNLFKTALISILVTTSSYGSSPFQNSEEYPQSSPTIGVISSTVLARLSDESEKNIYVSGSMGTICVGSSAYQFYRAFRHWGSLKEVRHHWTGILFLGAGYSLLASSLYNFKLMTFFEMVHRKVYYLEQEEKKKRHGWY